MEKKNSCVQKPVQFLFHPLLLFHTTICAITTTRPLPFGMDTSRRKDVLTRGMLQEKHIHVLHVNDSYTTLSQCNAGYTSYFTNNMKISLSNKRCVTEKKNTIISTVLPPEERRLQAFIQCRGSSQLETELRWQTVSSPFKKL